MSTARNLAIFYFIGIVVFLWALMGLNLYERHVQEAYSEEFGCYEYGIPFSPGVPQGYPEKSITTRPQGRNVTFSMYPTKVPGDEVVCRIIPYERIEVGHIIVYKKLDTFILHRVIDISDRDWETLKT